MTTTCEFVSSSGAPIDLDALNPEQLCTLWKEAEIERNLWQERLDQLGLKLLEHYPAKVEGSKSTRIGPYKLTTEGRMYRRLDRAIWSQICDQIPADLQPVKPELDESKFKALLLSNNAVFSLVDSAVKTTVGKTGVRVDL